MSASTLTLTLAGRQAVLALLAGAVLSAGLLPAPPVHAADEDTQASVYLVFDPETGEFVTVHDTDGTAQAKETQEAIDSVADVSAAGGGIAAPEVAGTSPTLIVGLVLAALIVVGGAVFYQRSRA